MNTTAQALIFAVASVASVAAIGLGLADHAANVAQAKTEIVHLERVVIVGKRASADVHVAMRVQQLPRVVIEGRRTVQVEVATAGAEHESAAI